MKNKVGKLGVSITIFTLLASIGNAQITNAPSKDVATSTSTNQVSATSTNQVSATSTNAVVVAGAATAGAATAKAIEKEAVDPVAVSSTSTPVEKPQPEPKELKKAPAKSRDWMDFIVGIGVVASPELGDSIDDMYNTAGYFNTDDYSGWLDLYLGWEVRPVNRFGIILGLDTMIGPNTDATGGAIDEEYISILFVPSVYGQFYFTQSRRFYVNAGINFPVPATDSDYFDYEGDGVGFGANIGVEIAGFIRIEGGYSYIPVTVKATSKNSVTPNFSGSYNYGGPQIRVLFAF